MPAPTDTRIGDFDVNEPLTDVVDVALPAASKCVVRLAAPMP